MRQQPAAEERKPRVFFAWMAGGERWHLESASELLD